jgi:hypothetical protein
MDPVRKALYGLLSADSGLSGLAPHGVHHRKAPQGTAFPYVVLFKYAGERRDTFDPEDFHKDEVWIVKGVCRGPEAEQAEAIDARCEKLLHNAPIAIEGSQTLYVCRDSDLDYGEDDKSADIHHVGGKYRLLYQPN